MRHLVVALSLVPLTVLFACQATVLELGTNDAPDDAADSGVFEAGDEAEASTMTTLEDELRAKCKAPRGHPDDLYAGARELSQKMTGRWYLCTPLSRSPLFDDGIEFTATHEWYRLQWADERHDTLARSTDPAHYGTVRCDAVVATDAGVGLDAGGVGPTTISCDDPFPRYPVQVRVEPNGAERTPVLEFSFEHDPTRAVGADIGGVERADLVPID